MAENKISIPRASCPEEVGVSSKEIARFMQYIKDGNIRFHSFMVIRHGKVAAECYFAPYNADTSHQMYSVSKSVTSENSGAFFTPVGTAANSDASIIKNLYARVLAL